MKDILKSTFKEVKDIRRILDLGNNIYNNIEKFEESNLQENLNNYLYLNYVAGKENSVLAFSSYFQNYEITTNKNIWTWVESSLTLLSRIYENSNNKISLIFKEKIKSTFKLGKNELIISVNNKARQRRLNGETLIYDKIDRAIENNDKELEFDYRLVQLKTLLFIRQINNSETMTRSMVDKEIETNISFLKQNL